MDRPPVTNETHAVKIECILDAYEGWTRKVEL